jgi:hypothetical protein
MDIGVEEIRLGGSRVVGSSLEKSRLGEVCAELLLKRDRSTQVKTTHPKPTSHHIADKCLAAASRCIEKYMAIPLVECIDY